MENQHQLVIDSIERYFWLVVSAFGGIGIILIAIAGFIAQLLLQKFSASLQNQNNRDIESLKATLTQNNSKELETIKAVIAQNTAFTNNLAANHSATYQKIISKRLEVIEEYWNCILQSRDSIPSSVTLIYQILVDSETTVAGINKGKFLGAELAAVSLEDSSIKLASYSSEIDLKKPFISSKLWLLKYSYIGILGRSMFLLLDGYKSGNIKLWKNDEMISQFMQLALTDAETQYANNLTIGGIPHIIGLIENKIIDEIRRFLSNDDFINDSTEQFKIIDKFTNKKA